MLDNVLACIVYTGATKMNIIQRYRIKKEITQAIKAGEFTDIRKVRYKYCGMDITSYSVGDPNPARTLLTAAQMQTVASTNEDYDYMTQVRDTSGRLKYTQKVFAKHNNRKLAKAVYILLQQLANEK